MLGSFNICIVASTFVIYMCLHVILLNIKRENKSLVTQQIKAKIQTVIHTYIKLTST